MLYFFPFLTWLATVTSGVMLALLWNLGELRRFSAAVLILWFLVAVYCQFLAGSPVVGAVGLFLQTILAIILWLRWKLGS